MITRKIHDRRDANMAIRRHRLRDVVVEERRKELDNEQHNSYLGQCNINRAKVKRNNHIHDLN